MIVQDIEKEMSREAGPLAAYEVTKRDGDGNRYRVVEIAVTLAEIESNSHHAILNVRALDCGVMLHLDVGVVQVVVK